MLRCRRGSVSLATVIALVPLLGFVALGAEVGSWYVTKQHAQNAADSAAMSRALAIVNNNLQPDFGTLNGFASDVVLTTGNWSAGSFSPAPGGNAVQAVVTTCVSQALSLVVYTGTCNDGTPKSITIQATAVANVQSPAKLPCALAKTGAVTIQDAATQINAPDCGIASNGTPIGIKFGNGGGITPQTYNVGSTSTAGSCFGSYCNSVSPPVHTYAPPVTDPFSALATVIEGLTTLGTVNDCSKTCTLKPYGSCQCANDQESINSSITLNTSGVYFFSGGLTLLAQGSLSTAPGVSATIIVLPLPAGNGNGNSNPTALKMAGGSTFNITAPTDAPLTSSLPSQLQGNTGGPNPVTFASLLQDMAIFDPEVSPQILGGALMEGSGVFYLPLANPLNFQGNSDTASSTCTEIIAASIVFSGASTLSNSGCPSNIVPTSKFVVLEQ
jgi:hypothetical protein